MAMQDVESTVASFISARRKRASAAKTGDAALPRKRALEVEVEEEEVDDLLNAPRLRPKLPSDLEEAARPAKRRRLRPPLRLPDPWQRCTRELFRFRTLPEPCRGTFAAPKAVQAQAAAILDTGAAIGGIQFGASASGIFSASSSSGQASAAPSSGSGNIFGAAPAGGIFGAAPGASGGSIFGASGASSGASGGLFGAVGPASGGAFGAPGSLFGQASAGAAFGAAPAPAAGPSMFAQSFQQSRPGPGAARRRRR
ncbi:unnamed protein product [Effrenium voratum]|nr:unnamed protein product [Effrenium voratum]